MVALFPSLCAIATGREAGIVTSTYAALLSTAMPIIILAPALLVLPPAPVCPPLLDSPQEGLPYQEEHCHKQHGGD